MKKFIVGIPILKFFGILEDLNIICKEYNQYIDTWYISPPFGKDYASRLNVLIEPTKQNLLEIEQQIKIIKNNNQKIQLALNGLGLKKLSKEQILLDYNKWIHLFGEPDSIVLLDELVPYFQNLSIPLTYSYNNYYSKTKLNNLKYCDTIVLGNKDIRNIRFMQNLKQKYNINIELLLNNGCHFLCSHECGKICKIQQEQRIFEIGKYQALAEQSLLPEELKQYPDNLINYYKISSRPITAKFLYLTLFFYINMLSTQEINQYIDLTEPDNWRIFSRLDELLKNFKQEKIDINKILSIKDQIWKNIA